MPVLFRLKVFVAVVTPEVMAPKLLYAAVNAVVVFAAEDQAAAASNEPPVPVRFKTLEPPLNAPVTVKVLPAALESVVGVQLSVIEQKFPAVIETGAAEVPQVLAVIVICEPVTSAAFTPVAVMLPVLVNVKARVAVVFSDNVPKSVEVLALKLPTACKPVPLKDTWLGELGALVTKLSTALLEPTLEGVKTTLVVHEAPTASVAAQVLVKLGADLNRVRQQVIQLLSGFQGKESATAGAPDVGPQSATSKVLDQFAANANHQGDYYTGLASVMEKTCAAADDIFHGLRYEIADGTPGRNSVLNVCRRNVDIALNNRIHFRRSFSATTVEDEPEAEQVPLVQGGAATAQGSDDTAIEFDRMTEEDLLRGLDGLVRPVEADDDSD